MLEPLTEDQDTSFLTQVLLTASQVVLGEGGEALGLVPHLPLTD